MTLLDYDPFSISREIAPAQALTGNRPVPLGGPRTSLT
jgi:hypothetical protein